MELFPVVSENLEKVGFINTEEWIVFMQMLVDRKFPTDICLKLCLDVARWYGVQNTSQMRYQAETKRLWTIGYKLFCEKCVRYMSGYKNAGQIQGSSTRGERLPSQSHTSLYPGGGGGSTPPGYGWCVQLWIWDPYP